MRDDHDIHPDILASLEEEQDFIKSQGRARAQRIKIPEKESWLLRFLPAQLGPKKTPWARIAFHWINGRPTLCIRQTGRDFGGDPEARCKVCEVADELNNSQDKKVSYIGYKALAVPQWLMYALVFQKNDESVRGDAKWDAWEFWMHKSVYDDWREIYRRGLDRSEKSCLDWTTGRDIWVKNAGRGYKLDKEDPSPICKLDPNDPEKLDRIVKKIMGKINFKAPQLPDRETIDEICEKLEESAHRAARGRDDDRRGGGRDRDDDRRPSRREDDDRPRSRRDEDDDAPRSRREDDEPRRPARRDDDDAPRASRRDEDDRPARREEDDRPKRRDDDDAPRSRDRDEDRRPARRDEDERPRARREDDEPRGRRDDDDDRRPSRNDEPSDETEGDRESLDEGEQDDAQEQQPERTPPPSARRSEPPAATRGGGYAESTVDEDDNAPEERRDPAPPPRERPALDENDEAPTAVQPPKTAPKASGLSSRLQAGITGANKRP